MRKRRLAQVEDDIDRDALGELQPLIDDHRAVQRDRER